MRSTKSLIIAAALAATTMAAQADHVRPRLFSDVGTPPAAEDVSHANVSTKVMIERCGKFAKSMRLDHEGHIRDYAHSYRTGFCLGWINASMVFLNMRDESGAPALGVCLPEGIHTGEVLKSFLEFAKQHPDDLKYNPSFLIYWALLEQHPCKS